MAAVDGRMQRPSDGSPNNKRMCRMTSRSFRTFMRTHQKALWERDIGGVSRPPNRRRGLQKAVKGGPFRKGKTRSTIQKVRGTLKGRRPKWNRAAQ